MTPKQEVLLLVDDFISGTDRSIELINKVESLMVRHYLDTKVFENLTEGMALYRPFGEPYYYGEEDMLGLLSSNRQSIEDM